MQDIIKPQLKSITGSKKSPFSAVRWQGTQPEVQVGEEWFRLVSLDKITVEEIEAFTQTSYKEYWQKRFEEDLFEVLIKMGHTPQETLRLVIKPLDSQENRTLENVPMTAANRATIYVAATARQLEQDKSNRHNTTMP